MRELLAFSRQHVLVTQVVDLNEVVAGVENMLRHLIGKGVDLVTLPGAGALARESRSGQNRAGHREPGC